MGREKSEEILAGIRNELVITDMSMGLWFDYRPMMGLLSEQRPARKTGHWEPRTRSITQANETVRTIIALKRQLI